METKFRTSFIPKKALSLKRQTPTAPAVHIFLAVGSVIFFLTLAGAGGVFFYQALIEKSIEEKSLALQKARQAFETSFIEEATRLDNRIASAKKILDNHTVVTPIFKFLEEYTLETVRFASFVYTYNDGAPVIEMEGEAQSYASIALQSDSFSESETMRNPVFAEPDLNPKGGVKFTFSGEFLPQLISYRADFEKRKKEQVEGNPFVPVGGIPSSVPFEGQQFNRSEFEEPF